MPKLFGLNVFAVLLAAVVFFALGAVWYGVLFSDAWMAANGVSEQAPDADMGLWMGVGFLITLLQVFGLGFVLKKAAPSSTLGGAGIGLALSLLLAAPLSAYDFIYLPGHDAKLMAVDIGHFVIGWTLAALILGLFKAWK
ncbi:MAG: DUF1761 domain-containing protein [Parvularculaceae bacterium]|nr:DUF1761 domain-containing protein [Parvularculaceae bacterium]